MRDAGVGTAGTLRASERGVSTTVAYVLSLAISLLLVSGLLIAGGSFVDDQRERVTEDELGVLGDRLATGLIDADRLAGSTDNGTTSLRVPLSERAAGSGYTVAIENVSGATEPYRYALVLQSRAADASANVTVRTKTPVVPTSLGGGAVVISSVDDDGDGDRELVVDSGPLTPPAQLLAGARPSLPAANVPATTSRTGGVN